MIGQAGFRIGGTYSVEPSLNRVTGPNGITRLEPKVMLVLVCLAEHAGQMVTKERLFRAAWPDTAVGDDVLTRAISELRRLFDDDPKQSRVIETIPKAGYRLIAPVTPLPTDAADETASPSRQPPGTENRATGLFRGDRGRLRIAVMAAALILTTAAVAWWMGPRRRGETLPMRAVPLTVLPGREQWPTFSPDGDQVAFEWDGENGDNADIYITMVGSSEVRRLTTDPGSDRAPSWSPEGRQIAYVRGSPPSGGRIHLVSPLGGSDRTLSDFPVSEPLAWSPDGRFLAAQGSGPTGIYLVPMDGGAPRRIIESRPPRTESAPAFSPDGRHLAYRSCATPRFGCDVYVIDIDLDQALVALSSPRRLTPAAVPLIGSLTWTRDGRSVIYNSLAPLITYLWRVDVDGTRPPERLEAAGLGAAMPATALSRDRLAFVRIVVDIDVYAFQAGRPSVPLLVSSFFELETRFSPDGRRLAFSSMRSADTLRIWTAASDGSGAQQFTRGPGFHQGSPWWSPDGRRIAFDAFTDDWHTHIWTMDVDAGVPQRLTTETGDQNVPYWSRDGRWIYFSADRGIGRDIWRVPAAGGPSQQVTRGGSGDFACESPDGQSLLYQPADADSPLLALPLAGGAARQLVECVKPTAFAAGPEGVYYVACDPGPDPELHVMNPVTGQDRLLGRLERYEYRFKPLGLAVSPDGASVLYPRRIRDSFDLMVIENFR